MKILRNKTYRNLIDITDTYKSMCKGYRLMYRDALRFFGEVVNDFFKKYTEDIEITRQEMIININEQNGI